MQLRMLTRRSLNGSMTVVGDIAQSTGAWAHADWDEVLEQLPDRRPARRTELTIGYRLPGPEHGAGHQGAGAGRPRPHAAHARCARRARSRASSRRPPAAIAAAVVEQALIERDAVDPGSVAVIVPDSLLAAVTDAFEEQGIEFGRAARNGLNSQITVVPVSLVKGLELDASVVVEPAAILEEEVQGARSLYVALTRATKRLVPSSTSARCPEVLRWRSS